MVCGKKIAALRKSKNMTQEELGKVLSVSYQAVSKWERDESLPDFEMMTRIAKYFDVSLNYFADEENPAPETPVEAPAAPVVEQAVPVAVVEEIVPAAGIVGMCTHCGKMVSKDEVAQMEPKILCKSCSDRLKAEAAARTAQMEQTARIRKDRAIYEQRGHGIDFSLFLSIAIAIVFYVIFAVVSNDPDPDVRMGGGIFLLIVPIAIFGGIQAFCGFVKELKDDFLDEPEGYSRNVSLITAGLFSLINLACFLALYIITEDTGYIIFLVLSVILSFTFVSQFMWGGVVKTIFTAGGFTFKLPGFIFSLTIDSILWMIITKFLLGLLAIIVYVVTTLVVTLVAVFVSLITFIPSLISKSASDKKVENENK